MGIKKRTAIVLVIAAIVLPSVYWLSKPEARGRLNYSVLSPDGTLELRTYALEAGAVGSSAEHAHVFDVSKGTEGDYIWFGPQLEEAPRWLDNHTVEIGNQVLDVRRDKYDIRSAAPAGFESPLVAAKTYLGAVARGDLQQARHATDQLLSASALAEERRLIFGVDAPISDAEFELRLSAKENGDQAVMEGAVEVGSPGAMVGRNVYVLAVRERQLWRVNFVALVKEDGDWRMRE